MNREERTIFDYKVMDSFCIGYKEIVVGENPAAAANEKYLCCYVESNSIFERYTEALVSDDFAEIAKVYGERITAAAKEAIDEMEKAAEQIGANEEITQSECIPISWKDSLERKIVVLRGDVLQPEFRHASKQLMLCTGGFGAQAEARGRTCYCTSLFDGKKYSYYRSDFLGMMDFENLPAWAKEPLEKEGDFNDA